MKNTTFQQQASIPKPRWQTGAYARHATYELILPEPFLMLCRLMDIPPRNMIIDFMDDMSCGSCWQRERRDAAREHLIRYFIAHGYGQQHYTEAEIREMFSQMDTVGRLFPWGSGIQMIDRYCKWRKKQQRCWFKQWRRRRG